MIKTFILEDLDCAHCANQIEEAIKKVEGVINCNVVFLSTKLTIEIEDGKEATIEKEIKKIVKKIEPDVTVKVK